MASATEIEQLRVETRYYHDRVALHRAKLYRWGLGSDARLQQLERKLDRAERRLQVARSRH